MWGAGQSLIEADHLTKEEKVKVLQGVNKFMVLRNIKTPNVIGTKGAVSGENETEHEILDRS